MIHELKTDRIDSKESIIILAAGSSSRLGQSKQLVEIGGITLLQKSTQAALDANYYKVWVVLGANADNHKSSIDHLPVEIIIHSDWEKGMGSSLKAGLQHIISSEKVIDAVTIMVCDQPMITSSHLKALRETYRTSSKFIVASRYGEIIGVPALFDQSLFPDLMKIKDSQGARVVIENNRHSVETIHWSDGSIDIDSPEDLKRLR